MLRVGRCKRTGHVSAFAMAFKAPELVKGKPPFAPNMRVQISLLQKTALMHYNRCTSCNRSIHNLCFSCCTALLRIYRQVLSSPISCPDQSLDVQQSRLRT